MAYEALTPTRFKELKPQFSDVDDATLQNYIDLAGRFVDDSWLEGDYEAAWAAMTCHLLTLDGVGVPEEEALLANYRITTIKSGVLTISRENAPQNEDEFKDWLGSTACGKFYMTLLMLNKRGPRLLTGWKDGCQSGYAKDYAPWLRGGF